MMRNFEKIGSSFLVRFLIAILLISFSLSVFAEPNFEELLQNFHFRSVGPAASGGRVVDIEVHPSRPYTIYLASASGGLWKSENNGTTWTPIFDNQGTISIGDVAIAPTNPDIVWVGTGEHNNQRSVLWGDGVYKSEDGGKTWQNMGFRDSLHIGRIVVDFKNPNVVYVAVSGWLFRAGGERGVYKTTDGGKTWNLVLKPENDTTGFIDIAQDSKDNRILYAAAYDRLRRPWHFRETGAGSALYKTTDAGKTWKRLTNGLPTGEIGRIGVVVSPSDTKIVYAVIENPAPRTGTAVYRSENSGQTWKKMNERALTGSYYYGQIRVDPKNPQRVFVLGTRLHKSEDGGKTFETIARGVHVDFHAMWIDPNNTNRILLGCDGGFYMSYDGGDTWDFINNLPIVQFYAIGVDMASPYNIVGGTQDNGVWLGPSRTRSGGGITNRHWSNIYGGDGMYSVPDPEDPYTIYTSSQFGDVVRIDLRRRVVRSIRPRESGLRYNWMTPFLTSPHNPRVLYLGAQKVFRSYDQGDNWHAISPDVTTNDAEKIKGNVPHCTITTIDESPIQAGVIWVGTDDGNLWITRDNGVSWTKLNDNLPADAPRGYWISRVVASAHEVGTAYVAITGFREEDFRPFLYKTTDFGKTFTSISKGLPNEPISVVREDKLNPKLLVVGTDLGCYISIDGGQNWHKMKNGLPTIAVHDIVIHPRDGDLVLGTHGRGIFICNIQVLRQYTDDVQGKPFHLFDPGTVLNMQPVFEMSDGFRGQRVFLAPNPEPGTKIAYYLKEPVTEEPMVQITDVAGNVVAEWKGEKSAGIHFISWDLRNQKTDRPRPLPSGSYLVQLKVGDKVEKKVLKIADWEP